VFGQGVYVTNEQRRAFSGVGATGAGRFYDHFRTDGYQVGGGVEYALMKNVYVKAAYKYSGYEDHTARQAVVGGVGVRF
jgi:outer membrane immunogenic protein